MQQKPNKNRKTTYINFSTHAYTPTLYRIHTWTDAPYCRCRPYTPMTSQYNIAYLASDRGKS